jgi:hypothetical protein
MTSGDSRSARSTEFANNSVRAFCHFTLSRLLRHAAAALPVRGPLPRGGKTVSARTLAPLAAATSTDAVGRHMPGAPMRQWSRGIYTDHRDRTRREASRRPFSGCAARASLQGPRSGSTATACEHGVSGRTSGFMTARGWPRTGAASAPQRAENARRGPRPAGRGAASPVHVSLARAPGGAGRGQDPRPRS